MEEGRRGKLLGRLPRIKPGLPVMVLGSAASLAVLYWLSRYNYLLFHSLAEIFGIVISFAIFVLAWNSRRLVDNHYLLFIGIAFLFTGGIDLFHTIAYKGMGIIPGNSADIPTQLWIAARYLESLSLLLALLFIRRKPRVSLVFTAYLGATVLLFVSIFVWGNFPSAFVEGAGLTRFKVFSEYIISLILLTSMIFLYLRRESFSTGVFRLMMASMAVAIVSEMAFTLYTDVYGIANMMGHMLKIVSFYLIYKAIIETGLNRPFELLFRNLKQNETDLANRATELKQVNSRLLQEVADRKKAEEELKRYAYELEAANKELEAFSYSVSHDLRAPLRAMDGFSQALIEDYAGKLDEAAKEYLERIQKASRTMQQLTDDLLKLSRITRQDMNYDTVNLSGIVQSLVEELKSAHPGRPVETVIASGITARGDGSLLKILLSNLLENAWKFSGQRSPARIEFGETVLNGDPVYYIKDNGAGFDMRYAERLFKPFQRLHTEKEFPGSGIGLAIAQRIVRRHGGRIWAESEVGKGATFYFTLNNG